MSVKETSVPDSVMTGTDLESQPDEKMSPQDHQVRPEDMEEKLPSEFTQVLCEITDKCLLG